MPRAIPPSELEFRRINTRTLDLAIQAMRSSDDWENDRIVQLLEKIRADDGTIIVESTPVITKSRKGG